MEEKITEIENDIVQELLNQIRDETEKRIEVEKGLKYKIKSLEAEYEYSEKKRLDF